MNRFELAGFSSSLLKAAAMIKEAPFKSEAQRRKFYAMASRGEISKKTVEKWEAETPGKKLPERAHRKSASIHDLYTLGTLSDDVYGSLLHGWLRHQAGQGRG